MTRDEILGLEGYLRKRMRSPELEVRQAPANADLAEVYDDGEFIATLTKDAEDGDLAYHFTMSILEIDLAEG